MRPVLSLALAGLLLSACAAGIPATNPGAQSVEISLATQESLGAYLKDVRNTRPGAFAVSEDGMNSYYVWCDEIGCYEISYAIPAIAGCESLSGQHCVALYVRDQARFSFTRATDKTGAGKHGSKTARPYYE